jgi:putative methyltransferase (TIGR04325 family)
MKKMRNLIKLAVPPLFVNAYRRFAKTKQSLRNTFEGVYRSFSEIENFSNYNSSQSLNKTYRKTVKKFEDYQRKQPLPKSKKRAQICNLLPMLAATLNNMQGNISILDFGGSMGTSYIDCLNSINCTDITYYVVDLLEEIELGRKIFPKGYNIHFLKSVSELEEVDIAYIGSALEYVSDYKALLVDLMSKNPKCILLTDHFMGTAKTYATVQLNMHARKIAYWIFNLDEIIQLFEEHNFSLIYKSVNYRPSHRFHNFPEYYRVNDSCNLLFKRKMK